jgi:hypothetical protein
MKAFLTSAEVFHVDRDMWSRPSSAALDESDQARRVRERWSQGPKVPAFLRSASCSNFISINT